ncbi:MAG TPA: hypothetical protein VFA65_12635 [Bryobacteraceae bacterium]|nr:hypothetical protein [Bryobacteraceae bacterium]
MVERIGAPIDGRPNWVCLIKDLHFEHPRADELASTLRAMGIEANVAKADQVRIIATIQTPNGRVVLV